jgi:hypothetical protein
VQSLHGRHTGRRDVVNEHRNIEVSLREHLGYVRKVRTDVVSGGFVLRPDLQFSELNTHPAYTPVYASLRTGKLLKTIV